MVRRDFLRSTGLVTTAWLVPGFLKALGSPGASSNGRKLVVVQLSGGNDGLNTIVPFRDEAYYAARPKLAIARDKVLRISDDLGWNPSLAPLRPLFDNGRIAIVNGVGYPNPDRSHFRSMDIWQTASSSDEYLRTGWLGRYLDAECGHPHGVIEFGPRLSLANTGEVRKAISLTDPRRFYAATREPFFAHLAAAPRATGHPQLGYLYKTMAETYQSAAFIHEKLRPRETAVAYPNSEIATSLHRIAGLISAGLDTRVYYTGVSGFDTHVNQAGKHERVLSAVAEALAVFLKDLEQEGLENDVLVMVFSEFGRRVKQNASNGTDHGTAGTLWLLGGGLAKGGFHNPVPSLDRLDANGDLIFSIDFRQVYATVLDRWLGVDPARILTRSMPVLQDLLD